MLSDWREEREIRKALKGLARQRVALILQPGDVRVIERALMHSERTDAILLTCEMRGWVEVMERAVPRGRLAPDGSLPQGSMFDSVGHTYKLTDSGWNAINRSHVWTMLGGFLAFLSLLATFVVAS